jgi:hypothetical protein
MARTPDQRAARVASGQLGLISRGQALGAGLTREQIRHRVRSARWEAVRRGVYRLEGHPRTWEQAVLAAVLGTAGTVAARRTALWLLGVRRDLARPEEIELTTTQTRVPGPRGCAVTTTRSLPPAHRTVAARVPCTTAARTLIDLATAPQPDRALLLSWTEQLINLGHTSAPQVHACALAARNGRVGALNILVDITGPDGAARLRSWLERHFGEDVANAGLPAPVWNVEIRDERGRIGEVDAVWHAQRIVVELDGLAFHRSPAQQRTDRARDRRLALAGWTVLRFTWHDVVTRPESVLAELRAALHA